MTGSMFGQPFPSVPQVGTSPFSFGPQGFPYQQSQASGPLGSGVLPQLLAQQGQGAGPLQQILQTVVQQLVQLNQQNQQHGYLLQQLIQVVPQQLQHIHQLLQFLPQVIQQQIQQQAGAGIGAFGSWQQPFGGSILSGLGMSPQVGAGQTGGGANLGIPTLGGQGGSVM